MAHKCREHEGWEVAAELKREVAAELKREVEAGRKTEVGAELERAIDVLEGGDLGAPLLDEGHVEQRPVTRGRLPPFGCHHAAQQ